MATRIKVELECERGHWVGVMDDGYDSLGQNPGGAKRKVDLPTYCPHASCGTKLSPWVRRRKAAR